MIGYKLIRKRKDGTYGPLFINASLRMQRGIWYKAEDKPTRGYAHRPGWHILPEPRAKHLSVNSQRVWVMVEFQHKATEERPAHQGGKWFLGHKMRILGEL